MCLAISSLRPTYFGIAWNNFLMSTKWIHGHCVSEGLFQRWRPQTSFLFTPSSYSTSVVTTGSSWVVCYVYAWWQITEFQFEFNEYLTRRPTRKAIFSRSPLSSFLHYVFQVLDLMCLAISSLRPCNKFIYLSKSGAFRGLIDLLACLAGGCEVLHIVVYAVPVITILYQGIGFLYPTWLTECSCDTTNSVLFGPL